MTSGDATPAARTRVVFFDLDGCLVDSTVPIQSCLNAAFAEHGLPPVPPGGLHRHIGPPLQVTLTELVAEQGRDPALVETLVAAYRERYAPMSVELALAYPGMAGLVADLATRERIGVVTSKPRRYAVPILEALELDRSFEVMVGPELTETEPKTRTLARALEMVDGCDVGSSVMVGDRHHDIEAALEHGLVAVGVSWGFGDRAELTTAGAVAVVDDAVELASVLDELPRSTTPGR